MLNFILNPKTLPSYTRRESERCYYQAADWVLGRCLDAVPQEQTGGHRNLKASSPYLQ